MKDSIKQEYTLVNGIRNGTYTSYYTNNNVFEKGNYIDGSREGIWNKNKKNGTLHQKSTYKNDSVFLSEFFLYDKKTSEITYKNGIYKEDYTALFTFVDSLIAGNYKYINDFIFKHRNVYRLPDRYDFNKWSTSVDSVVMHIIGLSSNDVLIRQFDREGHTIDSIVFNNGVQNYREERTYYTEQINKLYDKKIYIEEVLIKKFEFKYGDSHYKLYLYSEGKLESCGEIKNGSKKGEWEYYKNGKLFEVKKH